MSQPRVCVFFFTRRSPGTYWYIPCCIIQVCVHLGGLDFSGEAAATGEVAAPAPHVVPHPKDSLCAASRPVCGWNAAKVRAPGARLGDAVLRRVESFARFGAFFGVE